MVGDSRMVAFNKSFNDFYPVDEDIQKVLKINENISIGFAGDPKPTKAALHKLSYYETETLSLGQVKKILLENIKLQPVNKLGTKLIISGKNKYGKMLMYVIDSTKDYKVEMYEPNNQTPAFSCIGSDSQKVQPILNKYILNTFPWNNLNQLEQLMIKCIQEISKIDNSVNDRIQEAVIL